MNGSISLLRANPALTTNIKLVVDTEYNLYFESYSVNRELSDKQFKKFQITSDSFLSQRIATFYKGLPTDIAFAVKNDIQSDVIQDDYNNQFDDTYYSGARNVEDTRYTEEFQYNTTLKINPLTLPKYFMIFRVDGPGVKENYNDVPETGNSENISTYINNFKLISTFDLTPKTSIGQLWKKNYIDDDLLLRSPLELNFKEYEFSKWNGYDYYTGGTVSKSFFMTDYMQNQNTIFDFESFITDGFKQNGVISSHYSNISFLFDDTVAGIFYKSETPGQYKYYEKDYPYITKYIQDGLITNSQYKKSIDTSGGLDLVYYTFTEAVPYRKKWTINRYTGFYVDDLILFNKISPYVPGLFKLNQNIYLVDNVFRTANSPLAPTINPIDGVYDAQVPVYFKINNELFLIEEQTTGFVLISDKIFNGLIDDFIYSALKPIKIEYENDGFGTFRNFIKNTDNTYFVDSNVFFNPDSIFVIKIFDRYYRLNQAQNGTYIETDEYMACDSTSLYRKLSFNTPEIENLQVLNKDNNIPYFEIYQIKFTTISDWDFARTNTDFAKIEYNKTDSISYNRSFLYELDVLDTNIPKNVYTEKYYKIWLDDNTNPPALLYDNEFIIPLASEYAASGDLYMLNNTNQLTRIWDVNQSIVKWGLYQSVNTMSYPYRINNSLDVCGAYNFTPNMYSPYADSKDSTLDWFYTIGQPINYLLEDFYSLRTFSTYATYQKNITERSLNIDLPIIYSGLFGVPPYGNTEYYYKLDLEYYKTKNASIDYFNYIFNLPVQLDTFVPTKFQYYNRIAYLSMSDKVNGPSVSFKGINAYLQYVDTANPNSNNKFKTSPADDLEGYGFSVLYTSRSNFVPELGIEDPNLLGKAGIEIILNKIYKNILINIYVYTLPGTYTSLDYRERDKVYTDDYVYYTGWDDPLVMSAYMFYASELPVQALTIKSMIDILDQNKLVHQNFSQGIKYTIIENDDIYPISTFTCTFDFFTFTSLIKITYSADIPLKQGDWIYLDGTGYPEFDTNLQIVSKLDNRTITVRLGGDQTAAVTAINSFVGLNSVICTKEKSVYPFRLKIINPESIRINTNVNLIVGDTSCPTTPRNNFTLNSDILINLNDYYKNVPHVYIDNNISRKIFKLNSNTDLSYTQILQLPSIYRFSGDYEPILHNIDLFKQSALTVYNNGTGTGAPSISAVSVGYMESDLIDGKYYISVHIRDDIDQLYDPNINQTKIKVGDIFYFNASTDFPWIQFRTGHVIAVEESTVLSFINKSYRITLSIAFDATPSDIDLGLLSLNLEMFLYKYAPANTAFEYKYQDFGKLNDLIIAKTYNGVNPLQTSKDIYNTSNKYPMVDEHGVTTIDRFIFKSSWDPIFYYKTVSNKYITI